MYCEDVTSPLAGPAAKPPGGGNRRPASPPRLPGRSAARPAGWGLGLTESQAGAFTSPHAGEVGGEAAGWGYRVIRGRRELCPSTPLSNSREAGTLEDRLSGGGEDIRD